MNLRSVLILAVSAFAISGPAMAQGQGGGIGNQINQAVIDAYDAQGIDRRTPDRAEGTSMGDAVPGGFYGNAANPRESGHGTLPSQSPGPFVNNPSDPDNPTRGSSWG